MQEKHFDRRSDQTVRSAKLQRVVASQSGVAYLELAIILAILTPLMISFALAWLPSFSKRSNELMNALSSLGACLVDPINLYDFKAGQLVLKEDFQPIVQGVVQNCGQMAEGATACGFVYDNQGDNIYTFGLNETPDRLCSSIDVKQCVGKNQIPPGIVLAFLLENGEAECEHNPADDPAGDNQRGDESDSTNNSSTACATGYFAGACFLQSNPGGMGTGDLICCINGTVFNPNTQVCDGCPTGTHECVIRTSISGCSESDPNCIPYEAHRCVSDSDPLFSGGACCHETSSNPGVYCPDTEQECSPTVSASMPMCCPQGRTCADLETNGWPSCQVAGFICGCKKNSGTLSLVPGECAYTIRMPVAPDACGSNAGGDILLHPPGSC